MFRRLYWVKEIVESNGASTVIGVYTSIPDLIEHGLGREDDQKVRLSLFQLDRANGCLGVWTCSDLEHMEQDLQKFIKTDEMSQDHVNRLVHAFDHTVAA